jgi:hypothetical protein
MANGDGRTELELKSGLRRQLEVFLSFACHDGARDTPNNSADRRTLATTRNSSDNRAETKTTTDLPSGLLTFTAAFGFDVGGDDFVRAPTE